MHQFMQQYRARVYVVLKIEAAVNEHALLWCVEGLYAAGAIAEAALQFGRCDLVHLRVNPGDSISPNIMNRNE